MSENITSNIRLAKNTLLLYFRMFLLMAISLFTSRVILNTLGVEDYGIYNVVGGLVVMFGIITSTLSASISRYITVEIGKGNVDRLRTVFSTSVKVQLLISILIAVSAEIIGLWFISNKMQIPVDRYSAAQWVLHCSIMSFIVTLISVPYNATIVAHEKMSAFAYISILEAILKLLIVYALLVSPIDKLIAYSFLMLFIQIIIRFVYGYYCTKHFEECRGNSKFDKQLFIDIWKFAGWSILGNGAAVLNTQGVNMIMNVFFGVIVNAARGIANQVNSAVMQFVNNFTMALNPQITKSYASGDKETSYILACRGAKFSYLLLYTIALPIMLESNQILSFWLGVPPEDSPLYTVWTIMASLTIVLGQTLITLINASGDIKKYQIVITLFGFLPFPLTWLLFEYGFPAVSAFVIYFVIYYILIYIRLWLVHEKTGIPYSLYIKEVIIRTHVVSLISFIVGFLTIYYLEATFLRLVATFFICLICCIISSYTIGLSNQERTMINSKIRSIIIKK